MTCIKFWMSVLRMGEDRLLKLVMVRYVVLLSVNHNGNFIKGQDVSIRKSSSAVSGCYKTKREVN